MKHSHDGDSAFGPNGMSTRDVFAAFCACGLLAMCADSHVSIPEPDALGRQAYAFAEGMLKEMKRRNES